MTAWVRGCLGSVSVLGVVTDADLLLRYVFPLLGNNFQTFFNSKKVESL